MEIAAQRAREETERFLLPESVVERVKARELESDQEDGPSARKRKRPANGECDAACSAACALNTTWLMRHPRNRRGCCAACLAGECSCCCLHSRGACVGF